MTTDASLRRAMRIAAGVAHAGWLSCCSPSPPPAAPVAAAPPCVGVCTDALQAAVPSAVTTETTAVALGLTGTENTMAEDRGQAVAGQVEQQAATGTGGDAGGSNAQWLAAEQAREERWAEDVRRSGQEAARNGSACLVGHNVGGGWGYNDELGLPVHIGGCLVGPETFAYNDAVAEFAKQNGELRNSSMAARQHLKRATQLRPGHYDWHGIKAEVRRERRTYRLVASLDFLNVCGEQAFVLGDVQGTVASEVFEARRMRVVQEQDMIYVDAGAHILTVAPSGYLTIHSRLHMAQARDEAQLERQRRRR